MRLAENIRFYRRERSLTQEQLAEALGVTVGAVHKWEARLSQPELALIVEMADLFDVSVDVLLGVETLDHRPEACARRIRELRRAKDPAALTEAEKSLKRYPHDFALVHECAVTYRLYGIERHAGEQLRRALELQESALRLLGQNTDPEVGETSLYGETAQILLALEENEKAIDLLKKHNAAGIYSDLIGAALSCDDARLDEAAGYLSEAFVKHLSSLIRIVLATAAVYEKRGDYGSEREILLWAARTLSGLRREGRVSFLEKLGSALRVGLAYAQLKTGDADGARESLVRAKELAREFDAAPDYGAEAVRFADAAAGVSASDDLGVTAAEGVERAVEEYGDDRLRELWREIQWTET